MITTIIAIVGTLFIATADGSQHRIKSVIFPDMATCKAAGEQARTQFEPRGFQVRSVCFDTGVEVQVRIEGKTS